MLCKEIDYSLVEDGVDWRLIVSFNLVLEKYKKYCVFTLTKVDLISKIIIIQKKYELALCCVA